MGKPQELNISCKFGKQHINTKLYGAIRFNGAEQLTIYRGRKIITTAAWSQHVKTYHHFEQQLQEKYEGDLNYIDNLESDESDAG